MSSLLRCFLINFIKTVFGLIVAPTVWANTHPNVLTSIKPLALITFEITRGTDVDVNYLLSPTVSEHNYSLKPSDIKKLQAAQLVIWLDKDLEPYLYRTQDLWLKSPATKNLPLLSKLSVDVIKSDGHADVYPAVMDSEHAHTIDPHVWLSPLITQQIAVIITENLVKCFPGDRDRFYQNLNAFIPKLAALNNSTSAALSPYKNHPFLVYHSAYGYFEKQYALNQIGTLHTQPGASMSLKQLSELQLILDKQTDGVCLFLEPQFAILKAPAFKTRKPLKTGSLDPLGIEADNYGELIDNLTKGFIACFEGSPLKKKKA